MYELKDLKPARKLTSRTAIARTIREVGCTIDELRRDARFIGGCKFVVFGTAAQLEVLEWGNFTIEQRATLPHFAQHEVCAIVGQTH